MKIKTDYEGDKVWIIENKEDALKITKINELRLCVCGICGEYYYNDESLLDHILSHNKLQ